MGDCFKINQINYKKHKAIKTTLISVICLLICEICVSQQDALYSQYMFNPLVLNPAVAGTAEGVSMVLLSRSQWLGFEGAPSTQTFSIH